MRIIVDVRRIRLLLRISERCVELSVRTRTYIKRPLTLSSYQVQASASPTLLDEADDELSDETKLETLSSDLFTRLCMCDSVYMCVCVLREAKLKYNCRGGTLQDMPSPTTKP